MAKNKENDERKAQIAEVNKHIRDGINQWADIMLTADADRWAYELRYFPRDLMNAVLIFQHVASNIGIKAGRIDEKRAVEFGQRLRQLVIDMTGYDPHEFWKDPKNFENDESERVSETTDREKRPRNSQNQNKKVAMAKIMNNPVETMQLDIEFADNGIILRNPDIEDEVTLALRTETLSTSLQRFCDFDHSEEYRAIGKKIYDWLTEVAVAEHAGHWVSTGANLHIKAELTGRAS